jgi:hypothetical protein
VAPLCELAKHDDLAGFDVIIQQYRIENLLTQLILDSPVYVESGEDGNHISFLK